MRWRETLKRIPADVAFGVWKLDHPTGRVLAPDPDVEVDRLEVPKPTS